MISASLTSAKSGESLTMSGVGQAAAGGLQERPQRAGLRVPRVHQRGVGRGDVDLDEIRRRGQPLDERQVVVHRLAGHAGDQGHAARETGERPAKRVQPGVLKAVAVDESWSGRAAHADEVGLGMARARIPVIDFAVTAPKPSPMARRSSIAS